MKFKVLGIEHLAIATPSYGPMMEAFGKAFGVALEGVEDVAQQKVKTAFLKVAQLPIELLEPLAADSPISKFLEKRGSGMHHLAIRVDHIEIAMQELKSKGFIFIDDAPRKGAHDCLTAFLHPKSFHGLLVELVERPS
jgi:methylmalonyl-CoA/ethylmalonyl-CoA epimerase